MSQAKTIIGIDPGLSGGIVIVCDKAVRYKAVMPTIKIQLTTKHKTGKRKGEFKTQNRIDAQGIAKILMMFEDPRVFIEKAAPIFGVDTNTNFRIGQSAGVIEGVARALNLEWNEISSRAWQKEIWIEEDHVLRDKIRTETKQSSRDTKATSLKAYERLRGDFSAILPRCRNPHDGIVDAFLVAEYGRRQ